jgi:multidrug efflux pump subunit AcrA (membrane-fusion protein)
MPWFGSLSLLWLRSLSRETYFVIIGWPTDLTYYKLLTDWGSLIGGGFALIAGAALYFIGRIQVNATRESADKEIAATREAISAAQEQTRVAQEQIAVTLRVERRRIARESFAFLATLEAVMAGVIEDVEAARTIFVKPSGSHSAPAFAARQQVKKTAFGDLRSACLRLGGQLTAPFLRLDKEIDEFAAQWITIPSAGDPTPMGVNAGLLDQLERIELQAVSLREEAGNGMRRCITVLAEANEEDLP